MSVEFLYVDAEIDGNFEQVLISRNSLHVKCPVDISCSSYCNIVVGGKKHQVFWTWARTSDTSEIDINSSDDSGDELDSSSEIDNENSEDVLHTVPFKVLGSAYFVERQKCLEDAHKLLYERKVDVNAKLVPESNNKYDKNAIAVMLGFGNEWNKVGYIPTELTQFLHPLLNHNKITNVSLKHIKFRTTYQKVGFYATIEITRRGAWEQSVVKASKRVG